MSTPGYYKVNHSALSVSGLAQLRGLLRVPLAYLATRVMQPTPVGWMPTLWADLEAAESDLSVRFWEATARHRQDLRNLGFAALCYKRLTRILNPQHRDNGGVNYLDKTRSHFGQLIYNRTHVAPPVDIDKEQVTIVFTAIFERGSVSYTNNKTPFESLPHHRVVRLPSDDVPLMYQQFVNHLKDSGKSPRHFPDDGSLRRWFDENQVEVFEDRVERNVFIKMSDAEVEIARRKLPPPLPKGPDAA